MIRRLTCALFLAVPLAAMTRAADVPKPNVIVINIDDLGYADIEPFGSKLHPTPNLKRLAAEGMKLTSFYGAPVCSPSRSSLMTGCYPKRVGVPAVLFPAGATGINASELTVAELLKLRGYTTAIVGKWHLGDQPEFLPTRHGFDHYFGLPYSNDMGPAADGVKSNLGDPLPANPKGAGQPPLPLLRGEKVIQRVLAEDQTTLVARYTDEAVKFIKASKDKPFFLYLPHTAVHFPLYPGKAFQGKSGHGLYGDWVAEVDWSVGQVVDTVRELGLGAKTLVLFTSDNGGTARGSNAPLRGFKASTWEGGMREPTIAWWPGRIPPGTSSDAIASMMDVLPTVVKLAGGAVPADRKLDGVDLWPVLSGSAKESSRDAFFYFAGNQLQAVRSGPWKLQLIVPGQGAGAAKKANAKKDADKQAAPPKVPRLYNLTADIGETTDVSDTNPEVVKRLMTFVEKMDSDLGRDGTGPGVRPSGRVQNPQPLIGHDGKVREGFEAAQ
ncbi:MAG: sulfatase [Verrucomicrobia bacterium]|nr:sulfatase [Verrucomicrobiota bacterium]